MSQHAAPSAPHPEQTLAELEERLRDTPRAARPYEHAALRYAVGMAYAELPTGDHGVNLSRAVASYEAAAALFNPSRFPVEHARVRSALGAALRELGRAPEAIAMCQRAVELLADGQSPAELGAALNNLGLARSDQGDHDGAREALEQAVKVFAQSAEPRQELMARHNLGQAQAAAGDYRTAAASYREALERTETEELPYLWGLLQHSLGVALTGAGEADEAISAFEASLQVFTRQRYPFQHALAKNNLGLACAQKGDVPSLRRAVAAYHDAIGIFDVRVHRDQWQQVYSNLELAEQALTEAGHEGTRAEHFIALLAGTQDEEERLELARERLMFLLSLPEPRRGEALGELDVAALRTDDESMRRVTAAWLGVLLELPNELLLAGARARLAAEAYVKEHDGPEARQRAAEILEETIREEMLAPQRIRLRDTLETLGWERP